MTCVSSSADADSLKLEACLARLDAALLFTGGGILADVTEIASEVGSRISPCGSKGFARTPSHPASAARA